MKKQNNILKLIKNITYLTLACIAFNACTDEEIYKKALKYKFNAKVHDSHTNLLNFTKDSTPNYIIKK